MSTEKTAYPLTWPTGYARTMQRKRSRFGKWNSPLTIRTATTELLHQLKLMGATDVVLSTNLRLRMDGLPYSTQPLPSDPAVSVWWKMGSNERVLPCDRWDRVADNIYALALTIEAMRGIDRWVPAGVQERAFNGFEALPHITGEQWWEVLQVSPSSNAALVNAAYKECRAAAHPDKPGGSHERFVEVQAAYAAYKKERGL